VGMPGRRSLIPMLALVCGAGLVHAAPRPPSSPAIRLARQAQSRQALEAARAIQTPEARLAALDKIRVDFPGDNLANVDLEILTTLAAHFPERLGPISVVLERIVGRIPSTATADQRLTTLATAVSVLIQHHVLLDRAESLVAGPLEALDNDEVARRLRASAVRLENPEPSRAAIDAEFYSIKARGIEMLGRVALARGDVGAGLARLRSAVDTYPRATTAATAIVDHHLGAREIAKAEAAVAQLLTALPMSAAAAAAVTALSDHFMKQGEMARAEGVLKAALAVNPTLRSALLPLAKMAAGRGENARALEYYMTVAAGSSLRGPDLEAMKTLYRQRHDGSETGLESALDAIYRDKYKNPVTVEPYRPSPARTDRVVLLEMFTGSGCAPCIASDLALDAVRGRYAPREVIAIVYHANIPAPDPMVVSGGESRRQYYGVTVVPMMRFDGALSRAGGGPRDNTGQVYTDYVTTIDRALDVPARAALTVRAVGTGDAITVTATVGNLPADTKDLRLHIVLAERELTFGGENGIRLHPMVVRAVAGEAGAGLAIETARSFQQTFSLAAIRADMTAVLATELKRRKATLGSTATSFLAERGAITDIKTSELVVVAFIQAPDKRILQAAQTEVAFTSAGRSHAQD
jgi:tetratricopeptide (TPR) repeat protein